MLKYSKFCKSLFLRDLKNRVVYLKCSSKCIGTQSISKIGFIGLGAMGSHMARNLLKQYKEVHVFDVNDSATASLAEDGAQVAGRLEKLSHVNCIISMLPGSQDVLNVYDGPDGLLSKVAADTLIIDSSTVDPAIPQRLSAAASQRNATFIDAPVSGGIIAAAAGQLTFMVGGSVEGVQHSEPVLRAMGRNIIHCGPSGSGQVAKLCNNLLLAVSMAATAEAMNLGIRLGMDPTLLASVFNSSTGRCWSSDTYNPVPGVLPNAPATNNYKGGFAARLMLKDLFLVQEAAERIQVTTPFGKQALNMYKAVCEQGNANLDFSVIYKYVNELTNK